MKVSQNIDLEIIVDDVLSILNGGQETTANAILFCLLEIYKNKIVLNKLLNELDSVLGQKNTIEFDDLPKLEYLDCVFKETLRKYPPAVQYLRQANQTFELDGIVIPKNTWIAVSLIIIFLIIKIFNLKQTFKIKNNSLIIKKLLMVHFFKFA